VRQCVRVADHVYVLELGKNKVDGAASDFAKDADLRNLIAEWVDYRIDA
jgi:branched-chain amino acid transport system ATP-binding protein